MGVIGPNGAGNRPILKILTRILRPTRGSYVVNGRVGALIEVAAGFHPDLTGRENIFLQAAIMGMGQRQTRRKLDEIVAFSEVEEFLDMPVKRYSSGMNARLGFSIAAHLDPDVLIIDEVLAVGDYMFQKKAFGRIRDLARSGLPVVVVSHQLDRIAELCTDVLLLSRGAIVCMGAPPDVIGAYMRGGIAPGESTTGDSPIVLESSSTPEGSEVASGQMVRIRVTGRMNGEIGKHVEPIALIVRSAQTGEIVFGTGTTVHRLEFAEGEFALDVTLQMNVQPGIYLIDISVIDRATEKQLNRAPSLNVRVTPGADFLGAINLNSIMKLSSVGAPPPV